MSEEIIKVLDDLGKRFGIVIDWSNENVMPYLQDLMARFIKFQSAIAIMWMIISVVFIFLTIFIALKLHKEINKARENEDNTFIYDDDDEEQAKMVLWGISIILTIGFTIVFFCNLHGLIQNLIMPELSVLDYLKSAGVIN